ncbi:MAG: methyltransferase domain-containing protein [Candidatus Riflebacteria bacterium]|nr:methyltransferase domain-containing protein [Candidatus Riflebacteria bacterium]
MITSHSIKQTYNRFSSLYDLIFKPYLDFGRERAIKQLAPKSGARVLEIGVGTGLSLEYYPSNVEVLGFDYSYGMLKKSKIKARNLSHCPVNLMQMDAQNLAFADNSFDYLLGAYVLTVIPDPDKAVRELFRVARPGAKVVIMNYIRSRNKLMGLIEDIFHPVFASIGLFTLNHDLPGLLKQHGAQDIRIEPTSLLNLHFIVSFTVPA